MKIPSTFNIGQFVGIPCNIQPGPFPEEHVITIDTEDGLISGFASSENIKIVNENEGFVKGIILSLTDSHVVVQIQASLFTTASGYTSFRSVWAQKHLQQIAA